MARTLPPVDDDVFEALQALAEPLVDDVNSVLRRLLGLDGAEHETGKAGQGAPSPPSIPASRTAPRRAKRSGRPDTKSKAPKKPRAARGSLLPASEYELPMLQVLAERNGRAPASEVIEEIGRILGPRFQPDDHANISSGLVRWKNRAQFVRLNLIRAGDMVKESPRGMWEITEQGKQRAVVAA